MPRPKSAAKTLLANRINELQEKLEQEHRLVLVKDEQLRDARADIAKLSSKHEHYVSLLDSRSRLLRRERERSAEYRHVIIAFEKQIEVMYMMAKMWSMAGRGTDSAHSGDDCDRSAARD